MCVNFYVRACLTYIMYMFTHIVCVALSTRSSMDIIPKTKKFGCVGRGDLTSLFFSKVVKY